MTNPDEALSNDAKELLDSVMPIIADDDEGETEEEVVEETSEEPEINDEADEDSSEEPGPDEEDQGSPEAEEASAAEHGEDDTQEEKIEEDPVLAKAKELGLGDFKSREDFLKSQKNLLTRLSQRDEDAAFGRFVRDRGFTPEQIESKHKTKEEPQPKDPQASPPVFDPAWNSILNVETDDDGNPTGVVHGPADEVAKFRAYEKFQHGLRTDPIGTMSQYLAPTIESRVSALIEEREKHRLEQEQEKTVDERVAAFEAEHGEFLKDKQDAFWALVDGGSSPEMAVKYLRLESEHGQLQVENKTGDPAKNRDLERARTRSTRRAGVLTSPVKNNRPKPRNEDEALEGILQNALANMSPEERASWDQMEA